MHPRPWCLPHCCTHQATCPPGLQKRHSPRLPLFFLPPLSDAQGHLSHNETEPVRVGLSASMSSQGEARRVLPGRICFKKLPRLTLSGIKRHQVSPWKKRYPAEKFNFPLRAHTPIPLSHVQVGRSAGSQTSLGAHHGPPGTWLITINIGIVIYKTGTVTMTFPPHPRGRP